MPTLAWLLIGLVVFNALGTIALIGRRREPITPSLAVVTVVFAAFYIYAIISISGGTA